MPALAADTAPDRTDVDQPATQPPEAASAAPPTNEPGRDAELQQAMGGSSMDTSAVAEPRRAGAADGQGTAPDSTPQVLAAGLPSGAATQDVEPGNVGGAGVGTWIGSNKPQAGDFLLKDAATRDFFTTAPPEGKRLGDFYKVDGPLSKVPADYFNDAAVRRDTYLTETAKLPQRYALPNNAPVDVAETQSQGANQARNDAMNATREQLSQSGKDYSAALKERGLEWQSLADKGAQKMGVDGYANATDVQKVQINDGIVQSSGRSNVHVDDLVNEAKGVAGDAKFLRAANVVGKGLTAVGALVDGYSLYTQADQSAKTGDWENTAKEATRIGTAWSMAAGGAQLGATWGTAAGPVGTVVGGLVGGAVGYAVGSGAIEHGWDAAKGAANTIGSWFSGSN
jgi:hypothetical protein